MGNKGDPHATLSTKGGELTGVHKRPPLSRKIRIKERLVSLTLSGSCNVCPREVTAPSRHHHDITVCCTILSSLCQFGQTVVPWKSRKKNLPRRELILGTVTSDRRVLRQGSSNNRVYTLSVQPAR